MRLAPPAERAAVPRMTLPSRKVTVPLGVPDPVSDVTVAVNVTGWPKADGLSEATPVVVAITVCKVMLAAL